jgi:hypothetical protein
MKTSSLWINATESIIMKNSIYQINKGINKSIEFHGLKAQWIWWFGGLIIGLMLLFSGMYICGVATVICLGITGGSAFWGSIKIFALSKRYGENGLKKVIAFRRLPKHLRSYSRKIYTKWVKDQNQGGRE